MMRPAAEVAVSLCRDPVDFRKSINGLSALVAEELADLRAIRKALEAARELGAEESLIAFEGLTPQMVEALAKDGVTSLEEIDHVLGNG